MSDNDTTRDAAFYEANRDEPDLWGEPVKPEPLPRRQGLAATITVRFSEEEAAAICHLAKEADLTYSEIVRRAVQAFTRPQLTVQDGTVRQEFLPPRDLHHAAEGIVFAQWNCGVTPPETTSSSKPVPARPRS